jgi:minor extracellular serine protease Vpr
MKQRFPFLLAFSILGISAVPLFAAVLPSGRYALILSDAPLAERAGYSVQAQASAQESARLQIEAAQQSLRRELRSRRIDVVGAVNTLLNALFVQAAPARQSELESLPGVKAVVPLRRLRLKLNRALPLVNAGAAWNTLGGVGNAGLGMKIAIIDTGIDQTHPAFRDSSLPIPAGFPKCQGADCAFTNNKVIVARSYVRQLAAGTPPNPEVDSRPDDYSPRDRIGHGTANASIAAGVTNQGPAATITGIAPKAYLGNYKVFGSPEVNDFSQEDVLIAALEDAVKDGMDVASLSIGGPALSGPLDSGPACGQSGSAPCDLLAQAVESASKLGMVVVAAAGNEGDSGNRAPTFNTIDSPAYSPSAIAVGASTNAHQFTNSVRLPGGDVPPALQQFSALFSDGPFPSSPITALLRDVAGPNNDGLACASLPPGSLTGAFGLVQVGQCSLSRKISNASAAGALGVIVYLSDQEPLFSPTGLFSTAVPSVLISNSDGVALQSFADAHPDHAATLDPGLLEVVDTRNANRLAFFSSLGPSTGDSAIKPDTVAVGTEMYMATEKTDPLGDMYSPDGYTAADGTSFSTPLVAGAAALVKQKNPRFSPAQIKSALVNTATQDVIDNLGAPGTARETGGGKIEANAALNASVTSNPSSVSFGALSAGTPLPLTKSLVIANGGASAVNLAIAVAAITPDTTASVTTDQQSLSLNPGASATVAVRLSSATPGSFPTPGSYEGAVTLKGGSVSLRIPYLYLVPSQTPFNIIPLIGAQFDGNVNETIPEGAVAFKLIDRSGLPVAGAAVSFRVLAGGGSIDPAATMTDAYGIAAAVPVLGPSAGFQDFGASAGGLSLQFTGTARVKPAISNNGIVNGASFEQGIPVAPGSYISIFGTDLSDAVDQVQQLPFPMAIDFVTVSFDVPSAGLSLPGRLQYVSRGQINLQVPWEFQGQSSVQVKVSVGFSRSNVYTLALGPYSPALFEGTDSSGGAAAASLDENNQPIGPNNPALRGHTIELFANGLGPVSNQPGSGEAAPSVSLAETTTTPIVTIGGKPAQVAFSGLAAGFPALYQVNVMVPPDVTPGTQPLVVSIGGVRSKASNLAVQ